MRMSDTSSIEAEHSVLGSPPLSTQPASSSQPSPLTPALHPPGPPPLPSHHHHTNQKVLQSPSTSSFKSPRLTSKSDDSIQPVFNLKENGKKRKRKGGDSDSDEEDEGAGNGNKPGRKKKKLFQWMSGADLNGESNPSRQGDGPSQSSKRVYRKWSVAPTPRQGEQEFPERIEFLERRAAYIALKASQMFITEELIAILNRSDRSQTLQEAVDLSNVGMDSQSKDQLEKELLLLASRANAWGLDDYAENLLNSCLIGLASIFRPLADNGIAEPTQSEATPSLPVTATVVEAQKPVVAESISADVSVTSYSQPQTATSHGEFLRRVRANLQELNFIEMNEVLRMLGLTKSGNVQEKRDRLQLFIDQCLEVDPNGHFNFDDQTYQNIILGFKQTHDKKRGRPKAAPKFIQ